MREFDCGAEGCGFGPSSDHLPYKTVSVQPTVDRSLSEKGWRLPKAKMRSRLSYAKALETVGSNSHRPYSRTAKGHHFTNCRMRTVQPRIKLCSLVRAICVCVLDCRAQIMCICIRTAQTQSSLRMCAGWSVPALFAYHLATRENETFKEFWLKATLGVRPWPGM